MSEEKRPKFSFEEETVESLRLQRDALVDALADQLSPSMAEWVKSESINMHVPAISFRRVKEERDEARKEEGLYYHLFARLRRYLPRIDDMTPDDVAQRLRETLADAKADGMEEACALVPKAAALVLRARATEMRRAARVDPDAPPRKGKKR
jgi:hypothetical protein